jgi:hypothetical protein
MLYDDREDAMLDDYCSTVADFIKEEFFLLLFCVVVIIL